MKNQKQETQHIIGNSEMEFDFTKKFEPKDTTETFIKKAVTYAFTHFDIDKFYKWSFRLVAIVAIPFAVITVSNSITKHVVEQQKEDKAIATAQEQKEDKARTELLNNKINFIKSFSKDDMIKTVAFIKDNEKQDSIKLNTLYWKIKYLSEQNSTRYPIATYVEELSQLNINMHTHYDYRVVEANTTYTMIQQGAKVFDPTYDGDNPVIKLLNWKTLMETKKYSTYKDLASYEAKWNTELSRNIGYQNYLSEHQKDIQENPLFK